MLSGSIMLSFGPPVPLNIARLKPQERRKASLERSSGKNCHIAQLRALGGADSALPMIRQIWLAHGKRASNKPALTNDWLPFRLNHSTPTGSAITDCKLNFVSFTRKASSLKMEFVHGMYRQRIMCSREASTREPMVRVTSHQSCHN